MAYTDLEDYRFDPITGKEEPIDITEFFYLGQENIIKTEPSYKIFSFTLKESPVEGSCTITYSYANTLTTYVPPDQWRVNISTLANNSYTIVSGKTLEDTYSGHCEIKVSSTTNAIPLKAQYKGLGSQVNKKNLTTLLGDILDNGSLSKVDIPGYLLCDNRNTWVGSGDHDAPQSYSCVTGATANALGEKASVYGYNSRGYENSVAVGEKAFAEAGNIAIGSGAEAGQADAVRVPDRYTDIIAIGESTKVTANSSVAITNNFQCRNSDSTIVGMNIKVGIGFGVSAFGSKANAEGYNTTAFGAGANAEGLGAISVGSSSRAREYATSIGYRSRAGGYGVSIGSLANSMDSGISIGYLSKTMDEGINIGSDERSKSNEIRIGKNHDTVYLGVMEVKDGKIQVISDARDKVNKAPLNIDKEFLKKIDFIQFKLNERSKYIWNIVAVDNEGNPIMRPEKKALFDSIMAKSDIVPEDDSGASGNFVDPIVPRADEEGNITNEEWDFIEEYNNLPNFTAFPPIGEKWTGKLSKGIADDEADLINVFYTVEKNVLFRDDYEKATESRGKIRFGVTAQSVIKALPEAYLDYFKNDSIYLVENLCRSSPEKDPRHATNTNHDETVLELKDGASELCVDPEDMFWTVSKIVKDIIFELETYETKITESKLKADKIEAERNAILAFEKIKEFTSKTSRFNNTFHYLDTGELHFIEYTPISDTDPLTNGTTLFKELKYNDSGFPIEVEYSTGAPPSAPIRVTREANPNRRVKRQDVDGGGGLDPITEKITIDGVQYTSVAKVLNYNANNQINNITYRSV